MHANCVSLVELLLVFRYGWASVSLVARCQAAWEGQWVEAVFSNAPRATRRTCFTSLFTRSRSLTRTRTARPRPRTRNRIAASRLTVAPPRRQGDNPPDQVEHLTSRRPRPQPVSSRQPTNLPCSLRLVLSRSLKNNLGSVRNNYWLPEAINNVA